jgi:hypothetical protein
MEFIQLLHNNEKRFAFIRYFISFISDEIKEITSSIKINPLFVDREKENGLPTIIPHVISNNIKCLDFDIEMIDFTKLKKNFQNNKIYYIGIKNDLDYSDCYCDEV